MTDGTPFCARWKELVGGTGGSKWTDPGGSVFQQEKHAWGFPEQHQYKRPLGFGNLARGVRQGRAFRVIYRYTFKDSRSGSATRELFSIGRVPSQLWTSVSHPQNGGVGAGGVKKNKCSSNSVPALIFRLQLLGDGRAGWVFPGLGW